MTRAARVRAQAKINVTLRVLAREVSGYHQLETVFQRLDLADEVRLELTDGSRSLQCDGPMMPSGGLGPDDGNLAWRAAEAYLAAVGSPHGFRIEITKLIPTGGGLGGGSADAGAVLRVLQTLVGGLTDDAVLGIAASLGADIPFLTQDAAATALGWGRGERLLGLPALPATWCLLVAAPFGVNTAAAYGWLAERGATTPGTAMRSAGSLTSWRELARGAMNDFEAVVFPRHPELAAAYASLAAAVGDGAIVRMSGSGATLFALGTEVGKAAPAAVPGLPSGFTLLHSQTSELVEPVVLE